MLSVVKTAAMIMLPAPLLTAFVPREAPSDEALSAHGRRVVPGGGGAGGGGGVVGAAVRVWAVTEPEKRERERERQTDRQTDRQTWEWRERE